MNIKLIENSIYLVAYVELLILFLIYAQDNYHW